MVRNSTRIRKWFQVSGLIMIRIQAFEWYQFGWPSVTYNLDFKVTIIQRLENGTT